MADIAAHVGVSKMTVSRALARGAEGSSSRATSQALRQRILRACDEMGYVIDQTARSFSRQRSGFVAVLIPSLDNSNFSDTAQGIAAALEARGLQVLLGHTDYRDETEERVLRTLLARRPEGVVLTGGSHTPAVRAMLQAADVPVVETWDLPEAPLGHAVGFSNADAAAAMVRHLHGQGYRRIAFIGGTSGRDTRGADRRRGYARAMRELGLPDGRVIGFGQPPISMAQGGQAVAELLRQWPDTDAVLCVSDLSAFGALAECQRRGWQVPQRLAIAGFGDFEVSRACHPRITTVAVNCPALGQAAGELLLRAIEAAQARHPMPPETVLVPFRIEQREST